MQYFKENLLIKILQTLVYKNKRCYEQHTPFITSLQYRLVGGESHQLQPEISLRLQFQAVGNYYPFVVEQVDKLFLICAGQFHGLR